MALSTDQLETRQAQRVAAERQRQTRIAQNAATHGRTPYFDSQSRVAAAVVDDYSEIESLPVAREQAERPSDWSWEKILEKAGVTGAFWECASRNEFERAKNAGIPAIEHTALGRVPATLKRNGRTEIAVKVWVFLPDFGVWTAKSTAQHAVRGTGPLAQATEMRETYRKARSRAESIVRRKIALKVAAHLFVARRASERGTGTGISWIAMAGIAAAAAVALGGRLW